MIYNEILERGTAEFPIELYHLNESHPRYEMTAHWHSDMEFMRVLKGQLLVRLDEKKFTAKQGDVILVNPETVHSAIPKKGCIYQCIVMKWDIITITEPKCRFFIDNIQSKEIVINELHKKNEGEITNAVNALFDALKGETKGYRFSVISELYKTFAIILDHNLYDSVSNAYIVHSSNISTLKNVLSYMRDNFDKQLSLEDISANAQMSPKYFCVFFKNITGKTPFQYLISYRIECAARKLLNTNLSVTDVALSCGFNDLSYFIKTFKAYKGISPAKFRKM